MDWFGNQVKIRVARVDNLLQVTADVLREREHFREHFGLGKPVGTGINGRTA